MTKKKVKEQKTQYSIMLKPSLVKQIDSVANSVNMTRSQLMGLYIEFGMAGMKSIRISYDETLL
jgi:hypothetical protein